MNLRFANMAHRQSFRVHELQPRDSSIRPFGRDITNCQPRSSNISFVEKPVRKCEVLRIRSSLKGGPGEKGRMTMQQTYPTTQRSPKKGTEGQRAERIYESEFADSLLEQDVTVWLIQCSYQPRESMEGNEKMRAILIDWLVEIHEKCKLNDQTLHLCIRYLDAYCSKQDLLRHEFQLVGLVCMWIASKFQEIYPPKKEKYLDMTGRAFTVSQMLSVQNRILTTLSFRLVETTPYQILELVLSNEMFQKFGCLCLYLCEMCYTEGLTKRYRPSTIALTSVNLANSILKMEHAQIQHFREKFKTTNQQTVNCFKQTCRIMHTANKYGLNAIKRKYAQDKYYRVSGLRLEAEV